MSTITTNTSRLPVMQKCQRGATVITMSTDNPRVPGNASALAAFSAIQDELVSASLAVEIAQNALRESLLRRNGVEKRWDRGISRLAAITGALTDGDSAGILSTGFGIRGTNARPQPLPAPEGVRALTNGTPGRTKLTWNVLDGAVIFFIEMSLEPGAPVTWRYLTASTRISCELDGAEPGPANPPGSASPP